MNVCIVLCCLKSQKKMGIFFFTKKRYMEVEQLAKREYDMRGKTKKVGTNLNTRIQKIKLGLLSSRTKCGHIRTKRNIFLVPSLVSKIWHKIEKISYFVKKNMTPPFDRSFWDKTNRTTNNFQTYNLSIFVKIQFDLT